MKKIILVSVTLLLIIILGVALVGCSALGTRPGEKEHKLFKKSAQFDSTKKIFINRDREAFNRMNERTKSEDGIIKFLFSDEGNTKPKEGLPVLKPSLAQFLVPSEEMKVIWFGHSTFLLNLNGKIILVDPIISEYASPVFFIMKRFQEAPIALGDLPEIDFIVLSHDHYDHLDMPTIKYFKDKQTKFLVPLGVGSHLRGWGIQSKRIKELDWWQSSKEEGIEFTATPAQHFSGRSFNDRNSTLWAGWAIKNSRHKVFFSGDSGYDIHFKEIGEKLGPFDIAFLENGQYNVKWKEVHLLPDEGVKAFYDLRAKVLFPVHWGVFKLSTHTWYEPITKAYASSQEHHYPLIAPKIGEVVTISENYQTVPWWTEVGGKD